ncbi:hypothetical protein CLAIMM_04384 [Cladophialophora immunda]|nr:hypothetical protein CLAIMM_04384 [Cladophialophora immunda]
MADSEACFCKGSTQIKETCLLMLKLLRSLNLKFKNETFEAIANEMGTDAESLFCLYQQIRLSKKLARQLGCRCAINEEEQLRQDRKKRKHERAQNADASKQPAKRARIMSKERQDRYNATGANATAVVVPRLQQQKEEKEEDGIVASSALDRGVDVDMEESADNDQAVSQLI